MLIQQSKKTLHNTLCYAESDFTWLSIRELCRRLFTRGSPSPLRHHVKSLLIPDQPIIWT